MLFIENGCLLGYAVLFNRSLPTCPDEGGRKHF
jgi:hypothetical protein